MLKTSCVPLICAEVTDKRHTSSLVRYTLKYRESHQGHHACVTIEPSMKDFHLLDSLI